MGGEGGLGMSQRGLLRGAANDARNQRRPGITAREPLEPREPREPREPSIDVNNVLASRSIDARELRVSGCSFTATLETSRSFAATRERNHAFWRERRERRDCGEKRASHSRATFRQTMRLPNAVPARYSNRISLAKTRSYSSFAAPHFVRIFSRREGLRVWWWVGGGGCSRRPRPLFSHCLPPPHMCVPPFVHTCVCPPLFTHVCGPLRSHGIHADPIPQRPLRPPLPQLVPRPRLNNSARGPPRHLQRLLRHSPLLRSLLRLLLHVLRAVKAPLS